MNRRVLTLLVCGVGLLLAALFSGQADLAWMALPFLAYLGVGIWQAPAADRLKLSARRTAEKTDARAEARVEVRLSVRNEGATIPRLRLADPLQPGMCGPEGLRAMEGRPVQWAAVEAGEEARLEYSFAAERGRFAWKTAEVVASDPFGLVETRLALPAEADIQVLPEVRKLRPVALRPRNTLHSSGSVPAHLGGSGTDFWGVREYQAGDSLRWLDWRLAARHPHKLFTREFEQEEIADVGIILDAREKAELRVGGESLFEHSVRAAASLAEVFLRQGNRMSLLTNGKPAVRIFPGYGKVQLHRILRTLAEVRPTSEGSLNSLEYLPIRMFAANCLIVVISPLAANDWRLFPRLRAHGYQVLLISPDPFPMIERQLPQSEAHRLGLRAAKIERRLDLRRIEQLWIPTIDWQVEQPLSPLVRNALARNGMRHRLEGVRQ